MDKRFAHELAQKFAPTYRASEKERCYLAEMEERKRPRLLRAYPPWNPFVYYSVLELDPAEDVVAYEINYLTIWDWDTGGILGRWNAHLWDTERSAILVAGSCIESDADSFQARESYFAAHEGAITDSSCHCPCQSADHGVTVYWTLGKHASYPHRDAFPRYERFKQPGYTCEPGEYTLVDAGTVFEPKFPWVSFKRKWRKADSVYKKLRTRLWGRKTWKKIERPRYTQEDIKVLQEFSEVPATGELDKETIKAAQKVDPHLMNNIQVVSRKEFEAIYHSSMKGRDIDYVLKAGLSPNDIRKIAAHNLQGEPLRKLVKQKVSNVRIV